MKSKITLSAVAALVIIAALVAAGCARQSPAVVAPEKQMLQPVTQEQPAVVPEIAQAEQTVQEIGTGDIEEIDKDLDALVLP